MAGVQGGIKYLNKEYLSDSWNKQILAGRKAPIKVLVLFLTSSSNSIDYSCFGDYSTLFSYSPRQIQNFIDENISYRDNTVPLHSALRVLKERRGNCVDSAFVAALFLEGRYGATLLNLFTDKGRGHVVYLFQENDLYGTIGNSRSEKLKWHEPEYANVGELAETFREPLHELGLHLTRFRIDDLSLAREHEDWRTGKNGFLVNLDHILCKWGE